MKRTFAQPLALPLAALTLAVGAAGAAVAQPVGEPARGRLTPEQWQRIFPQHRELAIQDHRARIDILQRGERCLAGARNGDALRECLRQERSAYQAQRQRHRGEMRRLFESNGIVVPDWGKRGGKGRGGPGAGLL